MRYVYKLIDPRDFSIRYIGQTADPDKRLHHHINRSKYRLDKNQHHVCNWIRVLLMESVMPIMEVIEKCTDEEISDREIFWIEYYKEMGCDLTNETIGGENPILTDGIKNKISKSLSKGRVYKYDLLGNLVGKFNSIREAALSVNSKSAYISMVCNGHKKSHKGFIWKYDKNIECVMYKNNSKHHASYKVYQYDLDGIMLGEFKSIREASRKTGVSYGCISDCVNHKRKSAGGYQWTKGSTPDTYIKKGGAKIPIEQLLNGIVINNFVSATEASMKTGVNRKSISKTCLGQLKSAGGYQWRYQAKV